MEFLAGACMAIALALSAAAALPSEALAQEGREGLLTWHAESYAPQDYQGKVLPTQGSFVSVAFEFLEGGRPADLTAREMRWFLDNRLFARGEGLGAIRFPTSAGAGSSHFARVQVTDGRNILFETSVEIPVLAPRVSITPLSFDGTLAAGTNEFEATPFFMNVRGLDEIFFSWSVNGQVASPEGVLLPSKLSFPVPSTVAAGTPITVSVFANNRDNQLEQATRELRYTVR